MLNSPLLKPLLEYACGGSDSKESACNAGDLGLIPEWEDPLEEGIATHSSIFAWRIPWTEEPGRLRSKGLQRVRQDCGSTHTCTVSVTCDLVRGVHVIY